MGLSVLEIAANPFIILCGPLEYAEARLNFAQGVQAVGGVCSPLLASKVLFKADANSLIDVQWTYLGLSFFCYLLAIAYYYIPLPEASDADLEDMASHTPTATPHTHVSPLFHVRTVWITLGFGVLSQFCYVGGQESVNTSFNSYLRRVYPSLDPVNFQAIGHTAFTVSRFAGGFAALFIKPLHLLAFFYAGVIAFAAAAMTGYGATPAASIIMVYFFEGPLFPFIFAMSLRGCGKHTKTASALITAAISGGAVFPPMTYGATQTHNVQFAFCVAVVAFGVGALLPVWLYVSKDAREIVEPVKREDLDLSDTSSRQSTTALPTVRERRSTAWRRWSVRSLGTKVRKASRGSPESPQVEHREWTDTPDS